MTLNPSARLRIAIVGGGSAGWMTASALVKQAGPFCDITLVESEEIGTIGVGEATIPQIKLFNQLVGISEAEFLNKTKATIKLGIEFVDWLRPGTRYIHAFGSPGRALGGIDFHHYWLRANREDEGRAGSLWDYSINALAATQNRFANMEHIPDSPLAGPVSAYQFDAGLYAQYLSQLAQSQGVTRIEGRIVSHSLDPNDGHIKSIALEDGRQIEADLYIDCSGFRGLLIEGALKAGYQSWAHLLACDSALFVPSEKQASLAPYTRATALQAGWQWQIPLQHRTGNGHVFSSRHMDVDQAARLLIDNLETKPLAEPKLIRFETGRRQQFWKSNCIAIGLSAGFLEPLESTSLYLIQSGIGRLLGLFPYLSNGRFPEAMRQEYNRLTEIEYLSVRDFIILHYHANQRAGLSLWDECRTMAIPDSLVHRLELFRQTGLIHCDSNDLFQSSSWLQVMLGQGIVPQSSHPFVAKVSRPDREEYLENLRLLMQRGLETMPSHEAFLMATAQGR